MSKRQCFIHSAVFADILLYDDWGSVPYNFTHGMCNSHWDGPTHEVFDGHEQLFGDEFAVIFRWSYDLLECV